MLISEHSLMLTPVSSCFFFNDTATTEIYTLSLHDALPILFIIILFYLSLETEINIHVVGSAEHVEILRVERLVLLIRFLLILQQAYLFVSAGLDVLVVQQVLHFEAEPEGIRAADVPVQIGRASCRERV